MKTLFRTAALISVLTFLSRVLGLVRDSLIAMLFGASIVSDAFFIAFRPFDLCRKLFSEGVLNVSFIPVFSDITAKKGRERAVQAAFAFFFMLFFAALVIVAAGMLSAPWIIQVTVPGFVDTPAIYDQTVLMFRIMLPFILFVVLSAVCIAVLNALKQFAVPALSPVLLNLVIIGFAIWVCPQLEHPVLGLSFGVTAGGLVQFAIQLYALYRSGVLKLAATRIQNSHAFEMAKTALPCMVGAAAYPINMVIATFFASTLPEGSVSSLYFADRLLQFPLALFTISAATVLLPEMSQQAGEKKYHQIARLFENGFRLILFITVPAMAGLMALDTQIVALLFGRGQFDAAAVSQTAECTFYLVAGLLIFTGSRFFVTLHFSIRSVKPPFYAGLVSIFLHLAGAGLWMRYFGLNGLIYSLIFAAACGWGVLLLRPPSRIRLDGSRIRVSACRSIFISAIMFVLVKTASGWIPSQDTDSTGFAVMTLACIALGIGVYMGIHFILASPDLELILNKGRHKAS